ncbi:MAG TPA: hypothetical protein VGF99_06910 [Myxococcota bacterium]
MSVIGSLAVVVSLLAAAGGEPPSILKTAKSADRLTVDLTLKDPELAGCAATYAKNTDLDGLPCRLAIVAAVSDTPIATNDDVKKRRDVLNDALAVAEHVSSLPPGDTPSPGRRRARFAAHERACGIAFAAVAALDTVPTGGPAYGEARQLLAGGDYAKKACACAQRTTTLAVGADASPADQARVQGMLTTHHCLTGGAFELADRKGPGTSFGAGSSDTRAIADASSPAGRVAAMARGREVEFTRCTDKGMKDGRVSDADKLGTCACNVVKRWAMPLKKDDPKLTMDLPIVDGVLLPIVVEGGKVASCGAIVAK